ncbi:Transcriptional regulator of ribosomal biogenesis proteins [Podila verticillata]|nr:Transcriptional regulator of ribosomal biogenesis proteins [Podila verticillata]KAI9237520.1 MAG: hypothetical protein BYD32DRAFT_487240 [Podila humilis]
MPAPIEIQSPRLKQLHQQFSTSRQSTPLIQQYPYLASAFEFDSDFGARVFPGSPLADNTRAREFETAFCRDFYCCGLVLVDLHDLLQHYEECHVRFEEDEDDLAEQESEFLDDDSWSDSDSTPSSPSSSSALGSGLSSSGSGSGSRSDSSVTASLGPYQTRKTHSPLSHHQTLFHGYHLHPLQITDPNNSLVAPYLNSTTHAVEAFSSSYSGPNKRKAVVSLADIYAEDDNSDDLQGDASAFSNTILRSRSTASAAEILGPMNKRQAVESNQRSIAASIFSDAATTTAASQLLINKANHGAPGSYPFNGAAHLRPNNALGLTGQLNNPLANLSIFPGQATNGRQGPQPPLGGLLAGRPSIFLTPGGTPASAIDLLRQRDEVFSMIEDMSKPNANNSGDKPYRCTVLGCDKSYKNPNGLKYHNLHGHCSSSGLCGDDNPENKPYVCTFLECGKRYKNLNGLKYHIEHSHPNLIAALRAHHSGLTNPLLFGPYPNQAAMTIAAALAAVETSPMMLAAANAILTSASNAAAAANAASSSSNTTGGGNSGVGGQTTSGSNGGVPTPAPHGHVAAANMMSPIQTATPVVSIAPAMPLVRTIKDIAVPIGTVGGAMTAVPTLASLNDED